MAQRKRKQLTPYQREVQNLKRRIREAKKRGWMFEEVPIPRTAKAVRALRGEALWSKAYGFTEQQFGEFYSAQDVIKSLKAEAARRRQTTRKHPPRQEAQVVANRGQIALNELEQWVASYKPKTPTPTGSKKRNPRWERVMQAIYDSYQAIKETLEQVKYDLSVKYEQIDPPMSMDTWVGNQLANRLEAVDSVVPDLTNSIQYASTEEQAWQPAQQILAALHGSPMSIYQRKTLSDKLDPYDLTDYTDEDAFPV